MEAWEALDINDSDLSSFLLRPCSKTHHHNKHQTTAAFLDLHPPPPPPTPSHRIPGPAGAVQAAVTQKTQRMKFNDGFSSAGEVDPIPTQEYIRRAIEDPGNDDEDFVCTPWNFAVDFVRRQGLVGADGMAIGTPLSEINNGSHLNKVTQVVAIVKSCKPNELGDLMVTLKDPTGTIDASIHRKVLTHGKFASDLAVGAVLILRKVSVFSPSSSVHYLNITLGNVVKVISKEGEPLLEENYPGSEANDAAPVVEACEKSWIPQKGFSLSPARTEAIITNLKKTSNERGTTYTDMVVEERDGAPVSSSNQSTLGGKEPFMAKENIMNGRKRQAVGAKSFDSDPELLVGERPSPQTQAGSVQGSRVSDKFLVSNNQEKGDTNAVTKQKQPVISRGSLPQWTDEQLDELFA